MKIRVGDYMIWYGSKEKTGQFGIARLTADGGYLEPMRASGGDDKLYAHFLRSAGDFEVLALIIAETHGLYYRAAGPDKEGFCQALRIHPAVQFISQYGG